MKYNMDFKIRIRDHIANDRFIFTKNYVQSRDYLWKMAGVDKWRSCLNDQKFVKNIAENNVKDSRQKLKNIAKNLFVVDNSDLYVWDSYASHIVYFNLKQLLLGDLERRQRFQVETVNLKNVKY